MIAYTGAKVIHRRYERVVKKEAMDGFDDLGSSEVGELVERKLKLGIEKPVFLFEVVVCYLLNIPQLVISREKPYSHIKLNSTLR